LASGAVSAGAQTGTKAEQKASAASRNVRGVDIDGILAKARGEEKEEDFED
jgi:hypothetical protein